MRSHTGEQPYKCTLCGKAYGYKDSLNRHNMNGKCEGEGWQEKSATKVSCVIIVFELFFFCYSPTIRAIFAKSSFVIRAKWNVAMYWFGHNVFFLNIFHLQKNSLFKLQSASVFTSHMPVHTNERAYACDLCGERFTQEGHVRRHKDRLHSSPQMSRTDRKHVCLQCVPGTGFMTLLRTAVEGSRITIYPCQSG
jgi:hypothetical protein